MRVPARRLFPVLKYKFFPLQNAILYIFIFLKMRVVAREHFLFGNYSKRMQQLEVANPPFERPLLGFHQLAFRIERN